MTLIRYTCPNCSREFTSPSMNARYCTIRCKNSAGLKRRRIREAGFDEAAPKPLIQQRREVSAMADEILARQQAEADRADIIPSDLPEAPSQLESTIKDIFGEKRSEAEILAAAGGQFPECVVCGDRHAKGKCRFPEGNGEGGKED